MILFQTIANVKLLLLHYNYVFYVCNPDDVKPRKALSAIKLKPNLFFLAG